MIVEPVMQSAVTRTGQPAAPPIRVVVACGPPIVCEAFATRLSCEDDLHALSVPGTTSNTARPQGPLSSLAPNVVVIDLASDDQDVVEVVAEIRALPSGPAVVALVPKGGAKLAARLIDAGVAATVVKTAPSAELVHAVRWAASGAAWISPPLLREVLDHLHHGAGSSHDPRLSKLTARERDIVQLMVDGLGRQRMAEQLNLSIDTVRTHMRTMMQKLDVHSATATVSVALEAGLRPTPSRSPSL